MQRRKLEFDSEELELLSFDWKDIRQVRSPRIQDVALGDSSATSGPILVTPTTITVGGAAPVTFPRAEVESITRGGSKERNYWSGRLALGLTFHSGNTKELDYNAQARIERRTPDTRLSLGYVGNLSEVDKEETSHQHRVNGEFDYFLTSRLYLMMPVAEYFRDPFQNIAHRVTAGVGIGYDLIYLPKLEWTIFTGPASQHTWFDSVLPGEPGEAQAAAVLFGSKLAWELTRRVDFTLEYRGQYTSRTVDQSSQHAAAILEFKMTKRFDLDISLFWDHTGNPSAESDGDVPRRDDFRLVGGLGLRF
jgi:putative salt-induced outer membrane protein YdiY